MNAEAMLVAFVRRRAGAPSGAIGVGDDAAVVPPPRGKLVLTTDMLVERVDFFPGADLADVGWKALAASISDVAAMGGRPLWALASLALPAATASQDGRRILRGMLALARRRGVCLVGGDLSRSPGPVIVNVALAGDVERPVRRSGARPGHLLAVTGPLGLAALGLQHVRSGAIPRSALARRLVRAQLRPDPDSALGAALAPHASAMIDLSDGLSTDLGHLCAESRVGAVIDEASLPLAPDGAGVPAVRLKAALHGGEDFRLLLALPPRHAASVTKLGGIVIGRVTPGRTILLRRPSGTTMPLRPAGFRHF